jgi:hypothetical protein
MREFAKIPTPLQSLTKSHPQIDKTKAVSVAMPSGLSPSGKRLRSHDSLKCVTKKRDRMILSGWMEVRSHDFKWLNWKRDRMVLSGWIRSAIAYF